MRRGTNIALATVGFMLATARSQAQPIADNGLRAAAGSVPAGNSVVTPWISLTGGWLQANPVTPGGRPAPNLPGAYLNFIVPTAVAGRDQDVYIVDSGRGAVFRYNLTLNTMVIMQGLPSNPGTRLYVMGDLSLLVLDQAGRRVLHVTRDGALINSYSDDVTLGRPVGMTVDEGRGLVLVADALHSQVIAFPMLGRVSYPLVTPERDPGALRGLAAIASGPDGLYLLDPVARQVVRMELDGHIVETFGKGDLMQPSALAVDRAGRVVVSDRQSNTLKVFSGGALVEEIGGANGFPGGWRQISDLYADYAGLLYVADSAAGRVDILRTTLPSHGGSRK